MISQIYSIHQGLYIQIWEDLAKAPYLTDPTELCLKTESIFYPEIAHIHMAFVFCTLVLGHLGNISLPGIFKDEVTARGY